MTSELAGAIEAYLRRQLEDERLSVLSTERVTGAGLSRTVVPVKTRLGDGTAKDFIFLLGDAASPVPPNRAAEFAAMRALSDYTELKVPCAWGADDLPDLLGAPFVVTDMMPGTSSPRQLMKPAYCANARKIACEAFQILGRLAALDARDIDLGPQVGSPAAQEVHEAAIKREERILRENATTNRPIIQAALRHLRRNRPPPPARVSIVHGDYRIGNFLFDTEGVTGIIDWEMVHKGDPLEDLGWALMPNWEYGARPGLTAGFLSRDEAIAAWESTSGLRVDREALNWWMVYGHVKAAGIWATAGHMFTSGRSRDVVVAAVGFVIPQEEAALAEYLKSRAA